MIYATCLSLRKGSLFWVLKHAVLSVIQTKLVRRSYDNSANMHWSIFLLNTTGMNWTLFLLICVKYKRCTKLAWNLPFLFGMNPSCSFGKAPWELLSCTVWDSCNNAVTSFCIDYHSAPLLLNLHDACQVWSFCPMVIEFPIRFLTFNGSRVWMIYDLWFNCWRYSNRSTRWESLNFSIPSAYMNLLKAWLSTVSLIIVKI